MAQKKSPLAQMRETHKEKESLVDRILDVGIAFVGRDTEEKEALKTKLLSASNKKLLRLFEAASEVKTTFGSREKLAEAVAGLMGKAKDRDYIARLAKYTAPRLLSMHRSVEKKNKPAGGGTKTRAA